MVCWWTCSTKALFCLVVLGAVCLKAGLYSMFFNQRYLGRGINRNTMEQDSQEHQKTSPNMSISIRP